MFTKRITLFTLLGFEVRVDLSWLFLAVLVTWTLAKGVFPYYEPGLSQSAYWSMGVVGALGLFFSIVFHELSHSLVARRYGLPMTGITLFLFGGVAEMSDEPAAPSTEFRMAVAGPIASICLGIVFYGLAAAGEAGGWPVTIVGVLSYLSSINLILAIFNLVPAFPLDGGRMLRAALWYWKGDIRWATRLASRVGDGFGILLIVLGIVAALQGNLVTGIWWFLIGMFVRSAATMSYQQILIRQGFEGVPVRRVMTKDPVTVSPSLSLAELTHDYFYGHYHKTFPVVDRGRALGLVSVDDVKKVPRDDWSRTTVADVMKPLSNENSVAPDADAFSALKLMTRTGNSRLVVVADGVAAGIVAMKDLTRFLFLKLELEGGDTGMLGRHFGDT